MTTIETRNPNLRILAERIKHLDKIKTKEINRWFVFNISLLVFDLVIIGLNIFMEIIK